MSACSTSPSHLNKREKQSTGNERSAMREAPWERNVVPCLFCALICLLRERRLGTRQRACNTCPNCYQGHFQPYSLQLFWKVLYWWWLNLHGCKHGASGSKLVVLYFVLLQVYIANNRFVAYLIFHLVKNKSRRKVLIARPSALGRRLHQMWTSSVSSFSASGKVKTAGLTLPLFHGLASILFDFEMGNSSPIHGFEFRGCVIDFALGSPADKCYIRDK